MLAEVGLGAVAIPSGACMTSVVNCRAPMLSELWCKKCSARQLIDDSRQDEQKLGVKTDIVMDTLERF